ncbi:MAG: hypothetical protein Q9209_002480 [Squamulea sp. 1 TL-2023]
MVLREFHLVAHSSDSRKDEVISPPLHHDFDSFPPAVKRKTRTTSPLEVPPGRFARKVSLPSDRYSFEDAQLFRRLPDKVQQKQFSREEQQALTGYRDSLILDAADEVVLRASRQRNHSVPTIQTLNSFSSTSSVHTLEAEPPVDSAVDMDESMFDSLRWMYDDDDLDLTLADYHSHLVSSTEPASTTNARQPSFRRTISLTGQPQGDIHCPSSPEQIDCSRGTRSSSPVYPHQREGAQLRADHCDAMPPKTTTSRSTDQRAKHYQDPEARLKLRVYLGSPSKFDEALEFGFPSLESREHLPLPRRPSLSRTYHTEPTLQTFYESENPSFLDSTDSDSDEAESLPEMDIPNTPSDATFSRNTLRLPHSKRTSSDLDRAPFKSVAKPNLNNMEPPSSRRRPDTVAGCNREMTLRMTLTRPDLRASEDLLYGSGDSDPLALEHLPSPMAGNEIWEPGKEGGRTVKKFWKRVSRR